MFSKVYKLKSNNTLKNSEKKHLAQRIQEHFPKATEDAIKELVPTKATISCMKLVLNSGDITGVYIVDGIPTFLESDGTLYPTVCALWRVTNLVPMITVHSSVLSKLQNGAPLYLPGVQIPVGGVGFPEFRRGATVAINTENNAAAAAVGRAAMSSADMLLGSGGVAVENLHIIGDFLCKDNKFGKIDRPKLGPPTIENVDMTTLAANIQQLSIQQQKIKDEEWPSLGGSRERHVENAPRLIPEHEHSAVTEPAAEASADDSNVTVDAVDDDDDDDDDDMIPKDMDGLLKYCLLSFIKLEGKKVELPLKTNLFYKNHLMPLCPEGRTLDVKKSTYKKMSKFLDAMQKEGLLQCKEIEKGVDAIVALDLKHALVRAHNPTPSRGGGGRDPVPGGGGTKDPPTSYVPPVVQEARCVTAAVAPLFPNVKKGTAVSNAEIRAALTDYIKSHSLQNTDNKGMVTLDATLATITGGKQQEVVRWEAVAEGVGARMTASTRLLYADGTQRLSKQQLQPVTMHVATRSGNKKVTLVSNLEAFGFNLQELSKLCQLGVAASCGVTRAPGAAHDQLMLQGDQTYFVAKLLIEKYGLPKKYVEGADKALSKKNK